MGFLSITPAVLLKNKTTLCRRFFSAKIISELSIALAKGFISVKTLCGGQFTLSTQLIILNYPVIHYHRQSTTVSLKFIFDLDLLPSHRAISREKRGSICQGPQLVEYLFNQTVAYIEVTEKEVSSFCLQRTTCITRENEASNRYTSIRSQMI